MRSEGADFGFYGVLWFKGRHFDKPRHSDSPADLHVDLDIVRLNAGLGDIRVLVVDLSLPSQPSSRN
jgi:hypothetical protein